MSDGGTTRYSSEEEILLSWEDWPLNIAEGRTKLRYKDLLVFTTGASEISPGGFHDTLKLDFFKYQVLKSIIIRQHLHVT